MRLKARLLSSITSPEWPVLWVIRNFILCKPSWYRHGPELLQGGSDAAAPVETSPCQWAGNGWESAILEAATATWGSGVDLNPAWDRLVPVLPCFPPHQLTALNICLPPLLVGQAGPHDEWEQKVSGVNISCGPAKSDVATRPLLPTPHLWRRARSGIGAR